MPGVCGEDQEEDITEFQGRNEKSVLEICLAEAFAKMHPKQKQKQKKCTVKMRGSQRFNT